MHRLKLAQRTQHVTSAGYLCTSGSILCSNTLCECVRRVLFLARFPPLACPEPSLRQPLAIASKSQQLQAPSPTNQP